MERNFAAVTIFTLLFAVSTARISLDLTPTDFQSNVHEQPDSDCKVEDSNLGFLPSETTKSGPDGTENVQESTKDRIIRVDLTPRSDFARFHAINRRFFNEPRVPIRSVHTRPHRHFQNPFVIPPSKISHGNEVTLTGEIGNLQAENFHRQASSKRLTFKHDYRQHHHQQFHHHSHKHNNGVPMPDKFVGMKVVQQHQVKTREQVAGFMKSIRKFLKHTID